jgi:hypothetical protein
MRHYLISLLKLTFLFSLCIFLPCAVRAQSLDEEKIITDIEKERNYAITLGDEKALGDLLDESFSGVTASGKVVNKSEQIAIYKSTNPYVTFAAENVTVTIYESTATVRGTLVSKTKSGSTIGKTRYLYIYLKKDSKWKIIAGQETVVIKE